MIINKAMILGAGLGKRLRPLTDTLPKPMVPLLERPLIDYALDHVRALKRPMDVVVNTHYLPEILEKHLTTIPDFNIQFSREDVLLETGGGIVKALPLLEDASFFVINGDVICAPTTILSTLEAQWDSTKMDALLYLFPKEKARGFEGKGDYFCAADGHLVHRGDAPSAPTIYGGLWIAHPRLFQNAPSGKFSVVDLWHRAQAQGRLYGVVIDGYWIDVGNLSGLKQAEERLKQQRIL